MCFGGTILTSPAMHHKSNLCEHSTVVRLHTGVIRVRKMLKSIESPRRIPKVSFLCNLSMYLPFEPYLIPLRFTGATKTQAHKRCLETQKEEKNCQHGA